MTSPEDVALAADAGVDAVGIIVGPNQPGVTVERAAEIARAIPPFVSSVGVVGDDLSVAPALRKLGLTLQFSGRAAPEECERLAEGLPYIKAFFVGPTGDIETGSPEFGMHAYMHALWMFDAASAGRFGGSGIVFRWEILEELAKERPIVISGGLGAENVGPLLHTLRPYAVDVRSGLERDGRKDRDLMAAFVHAVRAADDAARR